MDDFSMESHLYAPAQVKNLAAGRIPADSAYLGEKLVWRRGSVPYLQGITNYYDYRQGLALPRWKNLRGGADAEIFGGDIAPDGALVVTGTEEDHGRFLTPAIPDFNHRTIYLVAKIEETATDTDSIILTGALRGLVKGGMFTIASVGKNNVKINPDALLYALWSDQADIGIVSKITALDYHVIALTRSGGENRLFIDASPAAEPVQNSGAYTSRQDGAYFGIGCMYRDSAYEAFGGITRKHFRFIATSDYPHTEEEVVRNSRWLMREFLK